MQGDEERTLWAGHPSHVKDLGFHVVCGLFCWLIVPLAMMLWRYLTTRSERYEVTSERIRVTTGVLSKTMSELELYRVKDAGIVQPLFLRIFKLSNLVLKTSDVSSPLLVIPAIPDAQVLRENLRGCIEKARDRKRVREVDYR
jgi:uncharacterized membrane protein YdbT with pleckstrin-like domain